MKNVSRLGGIRWVAIVAAIAILGCTAFIPAWTSRVYAATGTMYLTGTTSAPHGGTVTLNLRINPGTPVTVTQSAISYDASKLQFVGINTGGSAFDTNVSQSQSSGSIRIDRAKLDSAGVNSDALIATITFTALPYSGSTPVSLVAPSNAAYNGTYTNPALVGATVNFTPGSCPAGQTGTPPSCTTPPASSGGGTTSGTSTPNKTTTSGSKSATTPSEPTKTETTTPAQSSTLAVPDVTRTDFQYTVATISATTNMNAQVQVKYGLSKDALNFQTALTGSGKSHTLTLTENIPIATTVYYQVVASDGQTTKTTSVLTAKTKGLIVTILLLDKNRTPLANQDVSISGEKKKSSKDGYVTYSSLAPGHQIELKDGSTTHKQKFSILANILTEDGKQTTPDQNIFVVYDGYEPSAVLAALLYIGGGLAVIAAVTAAVIFWRRNGGFKFGGRSTPQMPIEGLIVGGQGSTQSITPKTPYDEPAYYPYEPENTSPRSER